MVVLPPDCHTVEADDAGNVTHQGRKVGRIEPTGRRWGERGENTIWRVVPIKGRETIGYDREHAAIRCAQVYLEARK